MIHQALLSMDAVINNTETNSFYIYYDDIYVVV